jgi:hypothetical protein
LKTVLADKTYHSVTFSSEEEFESICVRNAGRVFWSWVDSGVPIYVDMKQKVSSKAGKQTIPDGYLLWLDEDPELSCFYFIEYELASHPVYEHIIPQIVKFKQSLSNSETHGLLARAFHPRLAAALQQARFKKAYGRRYPHDVLTGLLSKKDSVGVVVVIDEVTDELRETIEQVAQLMDEYWVLEVNALVNVRGKSSPRVGAKVFGRYPSMGDDGSPEWYSATFKRKAGGKFVVQWTDGDRANTRVDQVVPFDRHILTVRVHS